MRFAGSAAMASGMAGSTAADALMPNNCFVAGTPVWVLRDGVDANAANAAMAEGADWRDFAEQKPIEEVEAGDYALSRPEDDADGQLRFMPVTETYANTTEEVVELWVVNYATGEHDHITTTPGHPFWTATSSGSTAGGRHERQSAGRDGGWEFAANLEPGDALRNADGRALTVTATAHKARHEATYNFCVAFDHTYYVGATTTWVHNTSRLPADEAGTWSGKRGNSVFYPNDPQRYGLKSGEGVPFVRGKPKFDAWEVDKVRVPGMTGDPTGDYNKAVAALAKKRGMTQKAVKSWLKEEKLRLHHKSPATMQVLPADVHSLPHRGAASELRNRTQPKAGCRN